MTFKSIEHALKIYSTPEDNLKGVVLMKVVIAILEIFGNWKIYEALPYILLICTSQLNLLRKTPKNFISMVVQTLAMAFWYNSALTFEILDQQLNQAIPVLKAIL
jgi:hypothetical protein